MFLRQEQRIAQEKLVQEKKEFEEKQAEAKFKERKNILFDEGYWEIFFRAEANENNEIAKSKLVAYSEDEFDKFLDAVKKARTPIDEVEVVSEEVIELPALNGIEEFANKIEVQEVEFEETLYQGTYKNLSENVVSFELVFAISDLPKFEHLTIKELLEPYNVPTLKQ